jgi:hypothetical protein
MLYNEMKELALQELRTKFEAAKLKKVITKHKRKHGKYARYTSHPADNARDRALASMFNAN